MKSVAEIAKAVSPLRVVGDSSRMFDNIQFDSRMVNESSAFIAIRGMQVDGHNFIQAAWNKGARVFFCEVEEKFADSTFVVLENTRRDMARIADAFYDFPASSLKVIGITGTNGKTTTAFLLQSILNAEGLKCGLLSTILTDDGLHRKSAERTTPESLDIFHLFRKMVKNSCNAVVMEVSSHALSLNRVDGVPFNVRVFTNFGRDHLDFHQSEDDYFQAKKQLFSGIESGQSAVLNMDDVKYPVLAGEVIVGDLLTYSLQHPQASVQYVSHYYKSGKMFLKVKIKGETVELQSGLFGLFNVSNIMAAVASAFALDVSIPAIIEGIKMLKNVPGRSEVFAAPNGKKVVVDYAHTPDGLAEVLNALKNTGCEKLTVVFGAGGNRDAGKRPEMGAFAGQYADKIWLTNDNPRNEDPKRIIDGILSGIKNRDIVRIVEDREAAIIAAIEKSEPNETILIAGKGHETYQEIKGKRIPFDDREIVKDYFVKQNWPIG